MKPYKQLTYQGQARRIREIAKVALSRNDLQYDKLSLIFHGENTTFRAKSRGGDYLVRVHRPGYQNRRTISSELEFLRALRERTDLVVPEPIGGVETFEAPGVDRRDAVVFRWIPGRFSEQFSPFTMRRLGVVVAELHRFAEQFRSSDRFERQFWNFEGLTGENMGGDLAAWPQESKGFVDDLLERCADVLDELGRGYDVWGLIHADLHHGNRLVSGGELAIIDFDDCGFGYFLYDLAVVLGFPRTKLPDEYPDLLEAFLAGYRQLRPMSQEHVQLLPVFFALRQIGIALWVLGRASDNPYFATRAPGQTESAVKALRELDALIP